MRFDLSDCRPPKVDRQLALLGIAINAVGILQIVNLGVQLSPVVELVPCDQAASPLASLVPVADPPAHFAIQRNGPDLRGGLNGQIVQRAGNHDASAHAAGWVIDRDLRIRAQRVKKVSSLFASPRLWYSK